MVILFQLLKERVGLLFDSKQMKTTNIVETWGESFSPTFKKEVAVWVQ